MPQTRAFPPPASHFPRAALPSHQATSPPPPKEFLQPAACVRKNLHWIYGSVASWGGGSRSKYRLQIPKNALAELTASRYTELAGASFADSDNYAQTRLNTSSRLKHRGSTLATPRTLDGIDTTPMLRKYCRTNCATASTKALIACTSRTLRTTATFYK